MSSWKGDALVRIEIDNNLKAYGCYWGKKYGVHGERIVINKELCEKNGCLRTTLKHELLHWLLDGVTNEEELVKKLAEVDMEVLTNLYMKEVSK